MQTRPRLRPQVPFLDRGDGELQVGTDTGLVLHHAGRREQRLLALLDGTNTLEDLATASGLEQTDVTWLVARLAEADLLIPAEPRNDRPLIRLLGAGTLARAFAEAYATAGVGDLLLVEPEPAPAGLYADPRPTGADSLRTHLRARGHQGVRSASHWYRPEGPRPDLTVIGYDRLECDRAITDTLLRTDQPHLFLRPLVDGVVIGPLVLPGRTCCTRCMDLLRTRDRGEACGVWGGELIVNGAIVARKRPRGRPRKNPLPLVAQAPTHLRGPLRPGVPAKRDRDAA